MGSGAVRVAGVFMAFIACCCGGAAAPTTQRKAPTRPGELYEFSGRVIGTQPGMLWCFAVSPDGKYAAAGGQDKTIRIWDLAAGNEFAKLEGHTRDVKAVAFSVDGKLLASGGEDATARVWDVQKKEMIALLPDHQQMVLSVAFHPNGKWVLTGCCDRNLRVWDVQTERVVATHPNSDCVRAISVSKDGRVVATATRSGTVEVWDLTAKRRLSEIKVSPKQLDAVAITSDGKRVAAIGANGGSIWNAATGKPVVRIDDDGRYRVGSIQFTDGDKTLLYSAGGARFVDAATGKQARLLVRPDRRQTYRIAASADGKVIAADLIPDAWTPNTLPQCPIAIIDRDPPAAAARPSFKTLLDAEPMGWRDLVTDKSLTGWETKDIFPVDGPDDLRLRGGKPREATVVTFDAATGLLQLKTEYRWQMYLKEEHRNFMLHVEWRPGEGRPDAEWTFPFRLRPDGEASQLVHVQTRGASVRGSAFVNGEVRILGTATLDAKQGTWHLGRSGYADQWRSRLAVPAPPTVVGQPAQSTLPPGAPFTVAAPGQWTVTEIVVKGNSVSVYTDGQLTARSDALFTERGRIGIELETETVEFFNLKLKPLPDTP